MSKLSYVNLFFKVNMMCFAVLILVAMIFIVFYTTDEMLLFDVLTHTAGTLFVEFNIDIEAHTVVSDENCRTWLMYLPL